MSVTFILILSLLGGGGCKTKSSKDTGAAAGIPKPKTASPTPAPGPAAASTPSTALPSAPNALTNGEDFSVSPAEDTLDYPVKPEELVENTTDIYVM